MWTCVKFFLIVLNNQQKTQSQKEEKTLCSDQNLFPFAFPCYASFSHLQRHNYKLLLSISPRVNRVLKARLDKKEPLGNMWVSISIRKYLIYGFYSLSSSFSSNLENKGGLCCILTEVMQVCVELSYVSAYIQYVNSSKSTFN